MNFNLLIRVFSAMFMKGPHGREFLNSAMKERMGLAAHPGAHPGTGESQGRGRLHPPGAGRMSPPIRTVEKEWGGKGGPMPGMRPTMGGPGIQPQQPKDGSHNANLYNCNHYILCIHHHEGEKY